MQHRAREKEGLSIRRGDGRDGVPGLEGAAMRGIGWRGAVAVRSGRVGRAKIADCMMVCGGGAEVRTAPARANREFRANALLKGVLGIRGCCGALQGRRGVLGFVVIVMRQCSQF
jgi:hypothetical protein